MEILVELKIKLKCETRKEDYILEHKSIDWIAFGPEKNANGPKTIDNIVNQDE